MSATLDGLAVSRVLGNAPVIESEGREFPVTTRYLQFPPEGYLEPRVAEAVRRALREESGDVLVFLPGQREIRRTETLLTDGSLPENVTVHTLYGEAGADQQEAALAPAPEGKRKIILSTSIAETSLTIDGVRVVVDSGLARSCAVRPATGNVGARYDARLGCRCRSAPRDGPGGRGPEYVIASGQKSSSRRWRLFRYRKSWQPILLRWRLTSRVGEALQGKGSVSSIPRRPLISLQARQLLQSLDALE